MEPSHGTERRALLKAAVADACQRMHVSLRLDATKIGDGWMEGPGGACLRRGDAGDEIWLSPSTQQSTDGWIIALHELEHLVFWHPTLGVEVPEQLMMPWAVGVLRCHGMPSSAYLGSGYTAMTALPELWIGERVFREVQCWKRPARSGWYQRAQQACIDCGVLSADLVPTWRRPDWSAIDIKVHEETFDIYGGGSRLAA